MTRAPRVLVSGVVLGQPMGGVRRHNAELLPRVARELAARGGSLSLLEGAERIAFDLPASIERIHSDVPASPAWLRAARETSALRRALAAARKAGAPFDLVHVAHLPAPRELGVPFTITLHDLRALDASSTPLARRLVAARVLRDAVTRAACVFTVSEFVADQIEAHFRLDRARLVRIGNGADHFQPLPRRPPPNARIACIGHLEPRKNIDVVLKALALDATLPDVDLFGAAKVGENERLRRLARERGVEPRVHFHGPFEEVQLPRMLAECACVALPSFVEGFGIVALEARRARAPLAIARAGALPEVAGHDTPSFDPTDPRECVSALHAALATSNEVLNEASERACSRTWKACANRWVAGWIGLVSR